MGQKKALPGQSDRADGVFPYALISIPLFMVKTMSSLALTVTWSARLPQRASSKLLMGFSPNSSTERMNRPNSRRRMPRWVMVEKKEVQQPCFMLLDFSL